ncbi:MAG: Ig-like domain-containing protein [Flavobacteriales bacterium]|nr:Ig-like domain-containing protein [Flavobacteriales bacterium]MCB9193456.1 Ig-like domain-containing protein [Flavobacteriales bacterium]
MRHLATGALLLCAACAQVRDPTGGPKDDTPPRLVNADPPNGSTGSTAQRITLRFNERIQLRNARKNLFVSPPLDPAPEVRQSGGYSVVIDLNAPLRPDRTYVFNLGDAVVDLTEGNQARDLVYVFSTGSVLDSLRIKGRVIDAFTGLPVEGSIVALYDASDTATLRDSRPAYFTRSDATGGFDLRYLHEGAYKIRALQDQNANYRYDLPNERIAFLKEDVVPAPPSATDQDLSLAMFQEASAVQQVVDRKVIPERAFRLVMAHRVERAELRNRDPDRPVPTWAPEVSSDQDTLLFWPSDTTRTDGLATVLAVDGEVLDTLTYRPLVKMPFYVTMRVLRAVRPDPHRIVIEASRPLDAIDTNRWQLMRDSVRVPATIVLDSTHARRIQVRWEGPPGGDLEARLQPRAVTDIYGAHNDSLILDLAGQDPRTLGTVDLEMELDSAWLPPVLVQLLDDQGRVARSDMQMDRKAQHHWPELPAGTYHLKAIADRNANGRWDPGILDEMIDPESVTIDPEPVRVRADWEIKVTWSPSGEKEK